MVKWKDPALSLFSCVTPRNFLDFAEFQFPPRKKMQIKSFWYDRKINLNNLFIDCVKCQAYNRYPINVISIL